MAANPDHYAIVIGIGSYPILNPLQGPVQDATNVWEWLVEPGPGGVPEENAKLILSPEPQEEGGIRPLKGEIDNAMFALTAKAKQQPARRFYVYFAGHGIESFQDDLLLVPTDATTDSLNLSMNTREYHAQLRRLESFPELVFFYDCCRTYDHRATGQEGPWSINWNKPLEAADYAMVVLFGARPNEKAFERGPDDSNRRGLFTKALLEGLKGGLHAEAVVLRDGERVVTTDSLDRYLSDRLPVLAGEHNLVQKPDRELKGEWRDVVLARLGPPVPRPVEVAAAPPNADVVVRDSDNVVVTTEPFVEGRASLRLPPGYYRLTLRPSGTERVVPVPLDGPVRVQF